MFKTAQNHVETFHQILPEVQTNSCLFISKVNKLFIEFVNGFFRFLYISEFGKKFFKKRVAVTNFLKLFHFDFLRLCEPLSRMRDLIQLMGFFAF